MSKETATFHGAITLASILVLTVLDWVARWQKRPKPLSSIRQQLRHVLLFSTFTSAYGKRTPRYSHISLCLLYSSFTKFMLLAVLSVWVPQVQKNIPPSTYMHKMPLDSPLWHLLDDNILDRTWLVRNLLGGMSAGFGLRGVFHTFSLFPWDGTDFSKWCWTAIPFSPPLSFSPVGRSKVVLSVS